MVLPEPIIIIAIPRSGSSMVSGIFANHGVFFGKGREADKYNPKGYFENKVISNLIKNKVTFDQHIIKNILCNEGYKEGPWAVKHAPGGFKYWEDFNPTVICCKRPLKPNYRSYKKFFNINFVDFRKFYKQKMEYMEKIGSCWIETDKLVKGDYTQIKKAFSKCDLKFVPEIADKFIDKGLWHD